MLLHLLRQGAVHEVVHALAVIVAVRGNGHVGGVAARVLTTFPPIPCRHSTSFLRSWVLLSISQIEISDELFLHRLSCQPSVGSLWSYLGVTEHFFLDRRGQWLLKLDFTHPFALLPSLGFANGELRLGRARRETLGVVLGGKVFGHSSGDSTQIRVFLQV